MGTTGHGEAGHWWADPLLSNHPPGPETTLSATQNPPRMWGLHKADSPPAWALELAGLVVALWGLVEPVSPPVEQG